MSDAFSNGFTARARRGLGVLATGTLLVLACSGGESNGADNAAATPGEAPASVEERRAILDQANAGQQPAAEPSAPVETGAAGADGATAPPAILDAVKADLAQRALASRGEISVVEVSAQEWPDGSLGCPTPGQMYTQMLTSGYRIVLAIADKQYDYRSTEQGQFVLCDKGAPLPPAAEQIKGEAPES
jgi:hypothetical protein